MAQLEDHQCTLPPSGESIKNKEFIKDLGIQFQVNLTFHKHIVATTAKGHRMAGWTLQTFRSRGKQLMLTLLKSLIVSHVEYAGLVWCLTDMCFISKMACFLTFDGALEIPVCTTDYSTSLAVLKIYSLQRRRERLLHIQNNYWSSHQPRHGDLI